MMLVRAANMKDFPAIYRLAKQSKGELTTFPTDKATIEYYLSTAERSFKGQKIENDRKIFIFVMEDLRKRRIVGISGIITNIGAKLPFFSYKLASVTRVSSVLKIRNTYHQLYLVNDYQNATELCMLYLHPDYRHHQNGEFLSRARLLFIAQHTRWFTNPIIAEIRGVIDNKGTSPFWESLGKHFFNVDFAKADRLTTTTNKQFIIDLMPRQPIYVSLLPKKVQRIIGKPHEQSRAALKILQREGFTYHDYVDIFDAGPTVEAHIKQIKTVQNSRLVKVAEIVNNIEEDNDYLLENTRGWSRVCRSSIYFLTSEQIKINKKVADVLQIKVGEKLRVVPFEMQKS